MEKIEPLVAIILVNYNGFFDTYECVKSLQKLSYPNYKIIIVDNGSNEEQVNLLRENEFINNSSIVLYSKENSGFSGGNNKGILFARKINADYVLLLNNDTVVTEFFLDYLIECAKLRGKAIVSGSIKLYSDKEKFWYAGGEYNYENGLTTMTAHVEEQFENDVKVSFASGCLMLIPMPYIEEYGSLDESFFLYSEDTEFCLRAIKNGYSIFWKPNSVIFHKESSSTGKNSPFQQYYLTRNDLFISSYYSNNIYKSILRVILFCLKRIIKGDYSFKPVFDAFTDYKKGIKGKSNRY